VLSHLEPDGHSCPEPNEHEIVTSIETCVSFLQSAFDGEPTLPVHTERDERAPLRIRDRVILRACVLPLWDATPILAPTDTIVWVL
jgi:hypothetical protein